MCTVTEHIETGTEVNTAVNSRVLLDSLTIAFLQLSGVRLCRFISVKSTTMWRESGPASREVAEDEHKDETQRTEQLKNLLFGRKPEIEFRELDGSVLRFPRDEVSFEIFPDPPEEGGFHIGMRNLEQQELLFRVDEEDMVLYGEDGTENPLTAELMMLINPMWQTSDQRQDREKAQIDRERAGKERAEHLAEQLSSAIFNSRKNIKDRAGEFRRGKVTFEIERIPPDGLHEDEGRYLISMTNSRNEVMMFRLSDKTELLEDDKGRTYSLAPDAIELIKGGS